MIIQFSIFILKDLLKQMPNYTLANIIGSASAEGQGWNREHGMPQKYILWNLSYVF